MSEYADGHNKVVWTDGRIREVIKEVVAVLTSDATLTPLVPAPTEPSMSALLEQMGKETATKHRPMLYYTGKVWVCQWGWRNRAQVECRAPTPEAAVRAAWEAVAGEVQG